MLIFNEYFLLHFDLFQNKLNSLLSVIITRMYKSIIIIIVIDNNYNHGTIIYSRYFSHNKSSRIHVYSDYLFFYAFFVYF